MLSNSIITVLMDDKLKDQKDSFYTPANMAALRESIEQDKRGEVITFKSVEALEKADCTIKP